MPRRGRDQATGGDGIVMPGIEARQTRDAENGNTRERDNTKSSNDRGAVQLAPGETVGQKHNARTTPMVRDDGRLAGAVRMLDEVVKVRDDGRLAGAVRMLDEVVKRLDKLTGEPDFDPDRKQAREQIANMRDELEVAARLVIARWSNG